LIVEEVVGGLVNLVLLWRGAHWSLSGRRLGLRKSLTR
jgi:hypothetical protein